MNFDGRCDNNDADNQIFIENCKKLKTVGWFTEFTWCTILLNIMSYSYILKR